MNPNQTRAIASSGGPLIPQRSVTPDRLIEAARSLAEAEIATWLVKQADVNRSPHTARRVVELAEKIQRGEHRRSRSPA